MPGAPVISVVVPTRSRARRLGALLRSLVAQELGEPFEIVVVADGATAAVEQVLAGFGDAVRVVRLEPGRGPAAARNAGWRAARAPLIAFTDDDCEAPPGWVAALREAVQAAPEGAVVQGRVEPLPRERGSIGAFARTLRVERAGPYFQTANILYPRALLERLDGFDEAFPAPAGEDTDLGWRAREAGAPVVFAEDALVWHAVHELGARGLVRDAPRWGSAVRLVKRHPGLRAHFTHRVFWKPAHERLLLAAAGVALAPRTRGVSLAAAAPYVLVHRGEHPSRADHLRALPAHLAVDVAEVAAMARGSIAARTLLL
ncbi:MAG TPA: glycosyltransferase [Solirubrobacteraceae bacterium]|nr:glycosyltransferase [Solirubrobacteraceae bacterium]